MDTNMYKPYILFFQTRIQNALWEASTVAPQTIPPPVSARIHMGTGSHPGYFTSDPILCLWPWNAMEDGLSPYDSESTWEVQKKLLFPNFRLVQLKPLQLFGE